MAKVIIYRQIQQEYHDITLLQGNILQITHNNLIFSANSPNTNALWHG